MIAIFKQIEATITININNNQPFVELLLPPDQEVAETEEVQHGVSSEKQKISDSSDEQAATEPRVVEKNSGNSKRGSSTRTRDSQTSHE